MAIGIITAGSLRSTTAGNKTVTATPVVGDLIIVIVASTGVATSAVSDNQGGTYTQVGTTQNGFSTSGNLQMFVRDLFVSSAVSTIYTATQTASTGGGLVVLRLSGASVAGAAGIRSTGGQSTGTAGTVPAPVLSLTPNIENAIIAAVANGTNSATTVVPRTGYTEQHDSGYNTPATGLEVCTLNTAELSATITFGSTTATAFASYAIEVIASVSSIYNESITLVSDNNLIVSELLDLEATITLLSNNTSEAVLVADLVASISVNSNNQISISNDLILEALSILSLDNTININGEIVFDNSINLSLDSLLTQVANFSFNENIVLSTDLSLAVLTQLILNELCNLSTNSVISNTVTLNLNSSVLLSLDSQAINLGFINSNNVVFIQSDALQNVGATKEMNENLNLNSNNIVNSVTNLEMNESLNLNLNNIVNSVTNLEINESLNLNLNNIVNSVTNLEINENLNLNSNNIVNLITNLEINQSLNLTTDSSLIDNNLVNFLNATVLLLDGQLEITNQQFSEVVMSLVSLSELSISEANELIATMQFETNNEILLDLIMEAYDQISLNTILGITTIENILIVINDVFQLNLNAEMLFNCSKSFQNSITLSVESFLEVIGEIEFVDYSNNEIIILKSKITNKLFFMSLICNQLLLKSKVIKKDYKNSLITNTKTFKSIITNCIILNSKIR